MMNVKQIIIKFMPARLFPYIEQFYYRFQLLFSKVRFQICGKRLSPYDIPIIINNYNRLEYLKRLIASLKVRGYNNIYILDNDSTYPPLLDFYKRADVNVIFLEKNWGYRAIWESGVVKKFWSSYYVYTDSDMEISRECPRDFMNYFLQILDQYPRCFKVGFGMKVDDLHDRYKHKEQVVLHEQQFWKKELRPGLFEAPIDTTFALYRPYTGTSANFNKMNIRTGAPYLIHHLPWYMDSDNPSAEEVYYVNSIITSTHWSKVNKS